MKKTIVAAVLSGMLAGGILVSAGSIMADSSENSQPSESSKIEIMRDRGGMKGFGDIGPGFIMKVQGGIETILDGLVAEGTITQAKANKISDFITQKYEDMKEQREEMKNMTQEEREAVRSEKQDNRVNLLTELVEKEIITQDEADAIQEKQQERMEAQREEMAARQKEIMETRYDQLVEEGIVSEAQADEIKEFIQAKAEERKAQMDELKDLTDAERKAFFEENKDRQKRVNILDEMVDEGIISQDQADKLAERKPMSGHFRQRNWDSLPEQQE